MPARHQRPRDSYAAWKRFLDQGTIPSGDVPEAIARSWQRCAQKPALSAGPPEPVCRDILRERLEANQRLKQWVLPEIEALAEELELSRSIVLLSDARGLIFHAAGGASFVNKAERVALRPGAAWTEDDRGTNAIGTAIAELHSVEVRGAEHFLAQNHHLYCAAVPIRSPRGELLGVLDISGDARDRHDTTLGVLRWAVQMIERRAALDSAEGDDILHFHVNPQLAGSHREGLILLQGNRIEGASPKALRLLGVDWKTLSGTTLDSLFEQTGTAGGGLVTLRAKDGRVFYGRLSPARPPAPVHSLPPPAFPALAPDKRAAMTSFPFTKNPADPAGRPECLAADERSALEHARRVLDAGVAVLIHGETGVGKEHFARRLHAVSGRRQGPFVAVNCGALPETLIDSELFGYEEGAFTGARRRGMPGRIREAHGGILFLDEIGDMPLSLQARLLRVLQEREVTPLGGRPVPVDFALVCATHRDLKTMVAAGTFRADLFYRLQGYTVELPPLRQRKDLGALIELLFLDEGGRETGLSLDMRALEAMARYDWPGNIRELQNVLRTLVALAEPGSVIGISQLPPHVLVAAPNVRATPEETPALGREQIARALKAADGCVTKAAERLGVHRSTIYRHLSRGGPGVAAGPAEHGTGGLPLEAENAAAPPEVTEGE